MAAFARHETFVPRFGWLRKGFLSASEDSTFFLQRDAHLQIGVGKNQGRSIRYWCHAMGLLGRSSDKEAGGSFPSLLGSRLLGARGWDPFLEDPASLWFLHWRLVHRRSAATSWHYAFTLLADVDFTVKGLALALADFAKTTFPNPRTVFASFEKDASCIVRMYAEPVNSGSVTEESIQSPFVELGLITRVRGASEDRYAFNIGQKRSLPPEIVAAACMEFAARVAPGTKTISLARLLSDPGSPGMAFKLGESALSDYLDQVARSNRKLLLTDGAGLVQLGFSGKPEELASQLLASHYRATHTTTAA